jgi:hypothetical protein
MAAPKGEENIDKLFNEVIILIAEKGLPTIKALKGKLSTQTFFDLLNDSEKSKSYARATRMRAELIEQETIEIADSKGKDINRDRLRVDTRKWLLAKLHPKKYGEKLDVTSDDKPIIPPIILFKDFTNE